MNEELISELIKECTKIFNDIKKKNNSEINKFLDSCLNNITLLKENIISKKSFSLSELLLIISNSFFQAINQIVINSKFSKFYLNILILIKKFIEYKLFSKEKSDDIIMTIKNFYNNSKADEECYKKIIEIIQTFIFSEYFEIKYDSLCILYIIILKLFNTTNNSRNKLFKNPIRLLFTSLTDKVYKSRNSEIIKQITTFIFSWYTGIHTEEINDNNEIKNEIIGIISKNKNNILIKCLSLELLSQGFMNMQKDVKDNDNDNKGNKGDINNFINDVILASISSNIEIIKINNSFSNDELNYLHYLKICKFLKILLFNYTINYDIIQQIIDIMNHADKMNKLFWKKILSIDLISKIISNYGLLFNLYKLQKEELIKNIFLLLNDYFDNDLGNNNDEEIKKKDIYENKIYLEGDEIIIVKNQNKREYINMINEKITILLDSLMKNNKENGITNIKEKNNNDIEEIIFIICDNFKNIIFKFFSYELHQINEDEDNNKNGNKKTDINKYINYLKNIMFLYNNNYQKKNEILKSLCNIALDYQNNKNEEENIIIIGLSLLSFLKEASLINKDSLIIILQTIEIFNHKYNYLKLNEYAKKDLNIIIQDLNLYLNKKNKITKKHSKIRIQINIQEENKESENKIIEKIDIQKDKNSFKKKESKEEQDDNDIKKKLCIEINELFLDMKIYNFESIKCIIEALCSCIDLSIKKYKNRNSKEKNDNKVINKIEEENDDMIINYEIIFYFCKILSLTLLNIDNIYILFEPFMTVIYNLIDNKIMIEFSVDVLCTLIPEILVKYEKIKSSINKNINEENKIWINEKWQKVLFSPLLTLLGQPNVFILLKQKLFFSIKKIIEQSAHYLDPYGWDSILQSCVIISNYTMENAFLIIKEILNDYNIYLSIFNVVQLMKLLNLFICEKKDKNMNFSSVELFWSCANIIDDYNQGKRILLENHKLYFNNILKGKNLKEYCDDLYLILFNYLTEINNEFSLDVKKSIFNIFTEIFVSKMNSMSKNICSKIMNDIFFKIFVINADNYITNNKNEEEERIFEISLTCIIKNMKEYIYENEKEIDIYDKYLNKINEIIPISSIQIITDILKSLIEIKVKKNSNVSLIKTKHQLKFDILSLIYNYVKNSNFILDKFNKSLIYRFYRTILSLLNSLFYEKSEEKEIYSEENIKNIFDLIDSLLISVCSLETRLIDSKPRKIMDIENDIFNTLENINIKKNFIYNHLIDKMTFNLEQPHTEAICKRSFESFQKLINEKINNNDMIFGINKEEKEIICKFIEKANNIMMLRNKNEIIEFLFNSSTDKNNIKAEINFGKYLTSFIKIINDIFQNFLQIKEKTNEIINNIYEIYNLSLDVFENLFKQSIEGYQSINKSYHLIIYEIYQQMDISSADFIMNKLFYYLLLFFKNEKDDLYEKLEKKYIYFIKLLSNISYNNNENYSESSNISFYHFFINELFKICKYKTKEEILNNLTNFNKNIIIDKEAFINNQIKLSKLLTNLLIQKIIEILKKYREDEKKSGGMPLNRRRIQEIISLLKNVKEFEVFPNFNISEDNKIKEKKFEEINIYDIISKNKKIHLFYIQPILNDFIYSKEDSIKSLIREIFDEIINIINMPKLINFD